jgi:hypothetical protein
LKELTSRTVLSTPRKLLPCVPLCVFPGQSKQQQIKQRKLFIFSLSHEASITKASITKELTQLSQLWTLQPLRPTAQPPDFA